MYVILLLTELQMCVFLYSLVLGASTQYEPAVAARNIVLFVSTLATLPGAPKVCFVCGHICWVVWQVWWWANAITIFRLIQKCWEKC